MKSKKEKQYEIPVKSTDWFSETNKVHKPFIGLIREKRQDMN